MSGRGRGLRAAAPLPLRVWVFGDTGAASIEDARAFGTLAEPAVEDLAELSVVDRLSSRARVFARVVAWGIVEPRVVVVERVPGARALRSARAASRAPSAPALVGDLLARLDSFPPIAPFGDLLRGLACR